ncbi:MAG: biotin-dependent carboxyltransferase family protein [Sphingobacteriales bacterium]|nr:MAG: biotin-dependent carboxyltransferase family protein [Sphingobacteriales bacterium]
MEVEIIKPGLLTTIQDNGRYRYRDIGVPSSGVMDQFAAALANILVANDDGAPVLELMTAEVEILTLTDIVIAVTGPGIVFSADGLTLPGWKAVYVPSGIRLSFKPGLQGKCAYIAITGGWAAKAALGSTSTYLPQKLGGIHGDVLQKGDRIKNGSLSANSKLIYSKLKHSSINSFRWGIFHATLMDYSRRIIRVLEGHEKNWFDQAGQDLFYHGEFSIGSRSDRMGYTLEGGVVTLKEPRQLISTAVNMGTIQITGQGNPIILMADCQTTGGYPRIAQIAAIDLPVIAQMRQGDQLRFQVIDIRQAESLLLEHKKAVASINKWINSKFSA